MSWAKSKLTLEAEEEYRKKCEAFENAQRFSKRKTKRSSNKPPVESFPTVSRKRTDYATWPSKESSTYIVYKALLETPEGLTRKQLEPILGRSPLSLGQAISSLIKSEAITTEGKAGRGNINSSYTYKITCLTPIGFKL